MTPLAHFGHWYGSIAFLVPVVMVLGWLRLQTRRDRDADDDPHEEPNDASE